MRQLPAYVQAETVSVYVSMPSGEVDTWALCRAVLQAGKRLYIPRFSTLASGAAADAHHAFTQDMQMLRVHSLDELEHGLTPNKWGIAEPPATYQGQAREDGRCTHSSALDPALGGSGLDAIVLPGMLFDRAGGRLGHGKGYYDRYVARARAFAAEHHRAPPALIALALEEQVRTERVPTDTNDVPVDFLVTPEAAFPCT